MLPFVVIGYAAVLCLGIKSKSQWFEDNGIYVFFAFVALFALAGGSAADIEVGFQ